MCKYLFMNPPVGSAGRIWPNLARDGESGPWNRLRHQQVALEHWLVAHIQTRQPMCPQNAAHYNEYGTLRHKKDQQ